jgi:hypothetical protein
VATIIEESGIKKQEMNDDDLIKIIKPISKSDKFKLVLSAPYPFYAIKLNEL